ncbi:MAG TPA: hypothetical protein VIL86_17185 [Tepidisphaeraceae bacterium]|jgi:hypothetical protein
MKRLTALLGGGFLAAGLTVGAFAHEGHAESDEGKKVTITGELIDTACFVTSDGDAKGKDHAACAQKCMATGVPAGILPEGKKADDMLYLLTNPVPLAPYASRTIKVEGVAYEDKHAVDVKHLYLKDGDNWKEITLKDEHHKMAGDKKEEMGGMKMDEK